MEKKMPIKHSVSALYKKAFEKAKSAFENSSESTLTFYEKALEKVKTAFIDCPDMIMRQVIFKNQITAYFIYIQVIVDVDILQRDFIAPLLCMEDLSVQNINKISNIPVSNLKSITDIDSISENILKGNVIFIAENMDFALSYSAKKQIERSIEEPTTEKNIKGSHEGFVESIDTNMGMIRTKIANTNLKFKKFTLGTISNQTVYIAYLEGTANLKLLAELTKKINSIKIDNVPTIGYIESYVSNFPNSPFSQSQATERPDKAVASLMEGKFVVMLDGVPNVMIAPISFFSLFQTLDDYSNRWLLGSFLRLLRYLSMLIAIFLPSIYIVLTAFHYYMIPIDLITTLADSRAKVPFPPVIELLIMEVSVEILREATIRLPTYIGMTIGVVGGIVIGQAAVDAGIVSNLILIILGLTAISASTLPSNDHALAIRYLRFIVLIFASLFGIIGITVCIMLLFAHLVTLDSLGEPYFQPFVPLKVKKLKDSIIRLPVKFFTKQSEFNSKDENL